MKKSKQLQLFPSPKSSHGGDLKFPQKRQRPLSTKDSMHIVLRSSEARGPRSFRKYSNEIDEILEKFAMKYSIEIISYANVGNHIHLHIKLFKRKLYSPFIRAVTAAIMIKVTGFCKWRPKPEGFQFWDHRPFSSIVKSYQAFKNLALYIEVNTFEGLGVARKQAESMVHKPLKFETS
jgi:REP element-mobilizing transposase RayT